VHPDVSAIRDDSSPNVALESSHAIWEAVRIARTLPKDADIVVVSNERFF
jgi:tryptophan synthase beta subunit